MKLIKHYPILENIFSALFEKKTIYFFTNNKWHSYELLYYLLYNNEKSNVIITSFGLSEEAIRMLAKCKELQLINTITIIINSSARRYKNNLLHYLDNIADNIYFSNIHAKIFLIEGKNNIIVNQSANFSTNPTNEAGFVSIDNYIYDFFQKELQSIITNSTIYVRKN